MEGSRGPRSSAQARSVFDEMLESEESARQIIERLGLGVDEHPVTEVEQDVEDPPRVFWVPFRGHDRSVRSCKLLVEPIQKE